MSSHPAILTPERIEAMLSGMAEVCYAGVTEAGARMPGAEDAEAFERTSRALQTACRNLRQTFAMKLRFDREQAAAAAIAATEARRLAEDERQAAEKVRRTDIARHSSRVRAHFGQALWNEYEEDDAQEIFDDMDERLDYLVKDDADVFLQTPVETLIVQLSQEFGVGDFKPEPEPDPEPPPPVAVEAPPKPPRLAPPPEPPSWSESESEPELEAEPAPRPPDPPAPDPWPEPYIPPWEKLRPGQVFPGGSGW